MLRLNPQDLRPGDVWINKTSWILVSSRINFDEYFKMTTWELTWFGKQKPDDYQPGLITKSWTSDSLFKISYRTSDET